MHFFLIPTLTLKNNNLISTDFIDTELSTNRIYIINKF